MPRFTKAINFYNLKKYFKNCLPATGVCGVRLLHDNALSHKAAIVREYLKQDKVFELPHPPYLPDLAPCDFFLFPRTPCWKEISNMGMSILKD
jgi:histone-lysine N-methyltransferase SETMAR